MAKGKGNGLAVIALLFGLISLGASGYMFFIAPPPGSEGPTGPEGPKGDDGIDGLDGQNGTTLVGLYNTIFGGSGDNFNLTLTGESVGVYGFLWFQSAETIRLWTPGWYRITCRLTLTSLENSDIYYINLVKNGEVNQTLDYFIYPVETSIQRTNVAYIYSDGTDIINFNCYSYFSDGFSIFNQIGWNQIGFEYLNT